MWRDVLKLRHLPLALWPLRYHAWFAAVAVAVISVCAALSFQKMSEQIAKLAAQQRQLQDELAVLGTDARIAGPADFSQRLPMGSLADDVIRDVGRFAQEAAVQISSLQVSTHAATPTQLGRVQFNIVRASGTLPFTGIRDIEYAGNGQ